MKYFKEARALLPPPKSRRSIYGPSGCRFSAASRVESRRSTCSPSLLLLVSANANRIFDSYGADGLMKRRNVWEGGCGGEGPGDAYMHLDGDAHEINDKTWHHDGW